MYLAAEDVLSSPKKRSLRELRVSKGFRSAQEFAEKIGVAASSYSRWENAGDGPDKSTSLENLWRIADALGCSIDAVVGREVERGRDIEERIVDLTVSNRRALGDVLDYLEWTQRR